MDLSLRDFGLRKRRGRGHFSTQMSRNACFDHVWKLALIISGKLALIITEHFGGFIGP
jgi:hypothetical protein